MELQTPDTTPLSSSQLEIGPATAQEGDPPTDWWPCPQGGICQNAAKCNPTRCVTPRDEAVAQDDDEPVPDMWDCPRGGLCSNSACLPDTCRPPSSERTTQIEITKSPECALIGAICTGNACALEAAIAANSASAWQ